MNGEDKLDAHTLGVLEAIEERSDVSQRRMAQRLDVALGLANSYLKRCVRKGWVKVKQVPGNRYLYYLTPHGFAEKSRLSARYLSYSLAFYRKAGSSCLRLFDTCQEAGWKRLILCGISDLAEIAFIRSQERDLNILGFIAPDYDRNRYLARPVYRDPARGPACDVWVITDLNDPAGTHEWLCRRLEQPRILVPDILDWRPAQAADAGNNS